MLTRGASLYWGQAWGRTLDWHGARTGTNTRKDFYAADGSSASARSRGGRAGRADRPVSGWVTVRSSADMGARGLGRIYGAARALRCCAPKTSALPKKNFPDAHRARTQRTHTGQKSGQMQSQWKTQNFIRTRRRAAARKPACHDSLGVQSFASRIPSSTVAARTMHLEHLECSHQPHIQGWGATKRTQRAG